MRSTRNWVVCAKASQPWEGLGAVAKGRFSNDSAVIPIMRAAIGVAKKAIARSAKPRRILWLRLIVRTGSRGRG
jgi:hypothetical protein